MKPLLAHIYEPHRVTYPCYVQPKLNGIRALYQDGRFQSRDELPFPEGLLEHLSSPLLKIFDERTILDGELYVHGWPLQRINAAVTPVRNKPTEDTVQVQYHVFDVVDFTKPFIVRHDIGQKISYVQGFGGKVTKVLTGVALNATRADEWYSQFVSDKYEGMMYRLGDCPYTVPKQQGSPLCSGVPNPNRKQFLSDKNNRCWHLLKRKDWRDDEFECVGVEEGEGKYQGTMGALRCKPKNHSLSSRYFTVGSGLTDSERDHYWSNPPIGKLVKVKYLVLSEDGIPLNPTVLAIL